MIFLVSVQGKWGGTWPAQIDDATQQMYTNVDLNLCPILIGMEATHVKGLKQQRRVLQQTTVSDLTNKMNFINIILGFPIFPVALGKIRRKAAGDTVPSAVMWLVAVVVQREGSLYRNNQSVGQGRRPYPYHPIHPCNFRWYLMTFK